MSRNSLAFSSQKPIWLNGDWTVSQPQVLLSQAGCFIVITLPEIDCTGVNRSVNEFADSSSTLPLLPRLFGYDSALLVKVMPLAVNVKSERLTAVRARVAILPST
nr:hypothetical protein [Lentzea atacamensis]